MTSNLSQQCDWFIQENQTKPRAEWLDSATCIFMFLLPHEHVVTVLIWAFVLLTLLSLLSNVVTVFGPERTEDISWESHVALLRNLAICDVIQTITIGPGVIYRLAQRRAMAFNTWCHIQFFVGTISHLSSSVNIIFMALERYIYLYHGISYAVIITKKRLWVALSLNWVFSVSLGSINMVMLYKGTEQSNEQVISGLLCKPDLVEQHMGFPPVAVIFRKTVYVSTFLACLVVCMFVCRRIYQAALAAIPPNAENTKARKTALFYCAMLFLQLLPHQIQMVSDAVWELEGTGAMIAPSSEPVSKANGPPSTMAAAFHMSLLVAHLVPPCINPLVYWMRNVKMRPALFSLVGGWAERVVGNVRQRGDLVV